MVKLNQFVPFSWQWICSCQSVVGLITFLTAVGGLGARARNLRRLRSDWWINLCYDRRQSKSKRAAAEIGRPMENCQIQGGRKGVKSFGRFTSREWNPTRKIDRHAHTNHVSLLFRRHKVFNLLAPDFSIKFQMSVTHSLTHSVWNEGRKERRQLTDWKKNELNLNRDTMLSGLYMVRGFVQ